jgi:hypothetical protein
MAPRIELAEGADENGFALMVSELIRQNIADHPEKRRDFERLRGRVAMVVSDAQVAVTLHFRREGLVVHDGIVGIPDLTIRAESEWITKMSLMELLPRLGLPDPRGENTRAVFGASGSGAIKMFGALANLPVVLRLTRVMSVA